MSKANLKCLTFRSWNFTDSSMPLKADLLESIKHEPSETNACKFDEG